MAAYSFATACTLRTKACISDLSEFKGKFQCSSIFYDMNFFGHFLQQISI